MRRCSCVYTSWLSLLTYSTLVLLPNLFSVTNLWCRLHSWNFSKCYSDVLRYSWKFLKALMDFHRPALILRSGQIAPHTPNRSAPLVDLQHEHCPFICFHIFFFCVTLQMLMITLEFLFFTRLHSYIYFCNYRHRFQVMKPTYSLVRTKRAKKTLLTLPVDHRLQVGWFYFLTLNIDLFMINHKWSQLRHRLTVPSTN